MNNKNEKLVAPKKINSNEENSISGGYIVKINPQDLKKQNIDLKQYLVIDENTGKIINSFDKYEDAAREDTEQNIIANEQMHTWQLRSDELKKHVFKTLDGEYIFKQF